MDEIYLFESILTNASPGRILSFEDDAVLQD
jgi:hypothetical protein